MSGAPTPRRRAGALATAAAVAALGSLLPTPTATAQDECPILDPDCLTTTTEETTTTVEETTTTEEVEEVEEPTTTEARRRQEQPQAPVETTSATVTITTLTDVLVPGDGTEGAESTTTTEARLASADGGISDETLILVIVGGLTLVAAVIGLLTWRYWDATRPTVGGR